MTAGLVIHLHSCSGGSSTAAGFRGPFQQSPINAKSLPREGPCRPLGWRKLLSNVEVALLPILATCMQIQQDLIAGEPLPKTFSVLPFPLQSRSAT
jgi:hypothetical protein